MFLTTATAGVGGQLVVYSAAALGIVMHYNAKTRRNDEDWSIRELVRHAVPKELVVSHWTWLDVGIYVINKFLLGLIFPGMALLMVATASTLRDFLNSYVKITVSASDNWISISIFVVSGLIVRDFVSFYAHYMQHRIPLLWEFHKVHHAPETLIPLSGHRLHPFDEYVGMVAEVVFLGILIGTYAWFTGHGLSYLIYLSVAFYTIVNIITFAPLRHSHIDLRLGVFERILLSPAHHRLHHSVERHHWDKNFAAIFPIWDRMFGTLCTPPQANEYRLGLPADASRQYATLLGCYWSPFSAALSGVRERGLITMLTPARVASHSEAATNNVQEGTGAIGAAPI